MRRLMNVFRFAGSSGAAPVELPVDLQLLETERGRARLRAIRYSVLGFGTRLAIDAALVGAGCLAGYSAARGRVPGIREIIALFGLAA